MLEKEYEYYKERNNEKRLDLFQTVSTSEKIMAANIIDIVFFFAGLVLTVILARMLPFFIPGLGLVGGVLYILIYFTFRVFAQGSSLGYLLMNIRLVKIKTADRVNGKDYWNYIVKNINSEVKITKIYSYYFNYDNWLKQNGAMHQSGLLVVNKSKFNKFNNEHKIISRKLHEIEKQMHFA